MTNNVQHRATITISSTDDKPEVEVEVDWEPGFDDMDPRELGYTPAAFAVMQEYIVPVLEKLYLESNYAEILSDSPSSRLN